MVALAASGRRRIFRIILGLGLAAACGAVVYVWQTMDPLRTHPFIVPYFTRYQISLLSHPQPRVASSAWQEINHLYQTKLASVAPILDNIDSPAPISFLVVRDQPDDRRDDGRAKDRFIATDRPIYYKADRLYCRTVGEALLAIVHRNGSWETDYDGDWTEWWAANRAVVEASLANERAHLQ